MAHEIVIPRLGWSMEEGTFVRWLKRDGDAVRRGEALFELEGEKALQEIEAVDEGILRIPHDAPLAGSVVPIGKILGYLVAEGESLPGETAVQAQACQATGRVGATFPTQDISGAGGAESGPAKERRAIIASPRARRIARELSIDWTQIQGSGAGGRIRERDVRTAARSRSEADPVPRRDTRQPISKRRRVIADRMIASRQQAVPVTLTTKADATNLVNLREQLKSGGETSMIPSFQDLITKVVAEVLRRHPLLAGRWEEDAIVLPGEDEIHIGVAVDTTQGLLVPVIRDVCSLPIAALAEQSRNLIERARTGQLSAAEMQGGVFTVTNLGAQGIDAFTPIINFPESAILGLGAIRREPVVLDDGLMVARHQLVLSLTFDHRIVDGAPAARFLQDLVSAIAILQ